MKPFVQTESNDSSSLNDLNYNNKKKNIERKLEIIRQNPIYTILVFYDQYETYKHIKDADKVLNILKKRVGSGYLQAQEVIQIYEQYRSLLETIWNELSKYNSLLSGDFLARWTSFDDPLQEKQVLVNKGNCFPYTARNEETAAFLVLLKVLRKTKIYYRTGTNYEDIIKLEQLKNLELKLQESLQTLNSRFKEKYSLKL